MFCCSITRATSGLTCETGRPRRLGICRDTDRVCSARMSDSDSFDQRNGEKLGGYDFWRTTLRSAKLVVAPMVDQSELAWRMLSRRYNAELCYTPMLHSSVFIRDERYRNDALASCEKDRPLIVQFCGNDPETFLKAAKYAEEHCDAIDINLGCPQQIAKRGHYGAFLQDEWDLLHKIISLCHEKLKVPVTAKIRIFSDVERTVRYAKMLEDAGCQLLTVHGRTKEQKGLHTGLASWAHVKAVKQNLKIPVFANGNIQYLQDVHKCIEETGVDGVMSAEGNLHNPALFSGVQPPVWDMAEEYLDLATEYPCPLSYTRGHLFKIMHHALLTHTAARDLLSTARSMQQMRQAVAMVKELSQEDVKLHERDPERFTSKLPFPYWICQPYVRPPFRDESQNLSAHKNKRPLDESSSTTEDGGLSKKQLKKLKRHPNKSFKRKTWQFDTCATCKNPKGLKCNFNLCKACCKKKCSGDIADCLGHSHLFKSRHEKRKEEKSETKTSEEISEKLSTVTSNNLKVSTDA